MYNKFAIASDKLRIKSNVERSLANHHVQCGKYPHHS
jgi:hypothetical protein